ncbi:TetR/AcrR family transcriptional regulator [Gracilibacillus alcaliphilus]|uniref:TetR/AcrR family transcriptional regulator n=1 Tax=Gracilibacillus alcaliphilus TaxID=1401441 RepID=UPI00195CCB7D|nr:TetR/AcrR family transcriptional regulator [Gracilibacillus alcaliphilus]MBM7679159.1 AcrR family transcriptional regulator [Gracilibacillus alcaliphilus]
MKAKITRQAIIDVTKEILDTQGIEAVTIKAVSANLGIKPPSLYNHVKNLEDLLDWMAYESIRNLYQHLLLATVGLEKKEALMAIAKEYREFAKQFPGQYELTQRISFWKSSQTKEISYQTVHLLEKIVERFNLSKDERIYFIRTLRSYLHGFTLLEVQHSFGLEQDIETSFLFGIELLLNQLKA